MGTGRKLASVVVLAALMAVPASAGPYESLYRALFIISTPIGGPLIGAGDGTRINGQRQGRLRIVPNRLGKGHRLELDRTFGLDSRGRPEVFDAGPFEVELAGATQMTLGYTSRFFPVVNGEFVANNLNYRASVKTGAVDGNIVGTVNLNNAFELNPLGFYTLSVNVSQDNSAIFFDSINDQNAEEIDFDIGPITARGNIYYDLFVALLSSLGVDTTELAALTPKSPIDQINEAIQNAYADAAAVAGYQVTAFDGDGLTLAPIDPLIPPSDLSALSDDATASASPAPAAAAIVPEPATLTLLAAGLLFLHRRGR
jgi:hypothetical protein